MAQPQIRIKLVKFVDGVYLHGTVVQSIGILDEGAEESSGRSLVGLSKVASITATPAGLIIMMRGKFYLVPWQMVGSCEIEDPYQSAGAGDLLGDEAALERATRPDNKQARR